MHPQKRYDDTMLTARTTSGSDARTAPTPNVAAGAEHLNHIHGHYRISNDDFRYTLSTFVVVPDPLAAPLRLARSRTTVEVTAWTNVMRDMGDCDGDHRRPRDVRRVRRTTWTPTRPRISATHPATSASRTRRCSSWPAGTRALCDLSCDAWSRPCSTSTCSTLSACRTRAPAPAGSPRRPYACAQRRPGVLPGAPRLTALRTNRAQLHRRAGGAADRPAAAAAAGAAHAATTEVSAQQQLVEPTSRDDHARPSAITTKYATCPSRPQRRTPRHSRSRSNAMPWLQRQALDHDPQPRRVDRQAVERPAEHEHRQDHDLHHVQILDRPHVGRDRHPDRAEGERDQQRRPAASGRPRRSASAPSRHDEHEAGRVQPATDQRPADLAERNVERTERRGQHAVVDLARSLQLEEHVHRRVVDRAVHRR